MTDKFVFTNQMMNDSNKLWEVTSIVGAGLCFLVLSVISVAFLHPVSRPHLNRVSFRMLIWALAANTIFGTANAITGSFTGPTWACGFSMFILQFSLEFSSLLIFCIALNLQLVVVQHIDGQRMEKYYILVSLILSLCLTIPPYAAKKYGWDPLIRACWYAIDDQQERFAWQIGTQLAWTMMTVVGEVCATLIVAIYVIKHRISCRRAMGSTSLFRESFLQWSTPSNLQHVNAYTNVMVRISLYPVASCIINITSIACVTHATSANGIKDVFSYRVLVLDDLMYGGRAIVYALLAATDPSLVRALKALVRHHTGNTVSNTSVKRALGRKMTAQHMRIEFTRTRDRNAMDMSPVREWGLEFDHPIPGALQIREEHGEPDGHDDKGRSQFDSTQNLRQRCQGALEEEKSFMRQI